MRQAADFIERIQAEEALRESEQQLSITMETAIDYAIISMDTDGLVQDWSRGAERCFQWTEAEMIGRSVDIIFTPEDQAAGVPQQEQETAIREGLAPDERWHVRKDGTRFYMSGVMRPIREGDAVHGFVKVARDLTEQRNAEEALRVNEERYRTALQSAGMAAWDWDVTADKVIWNEQHFLILGLQPDSLPIDTAFFLSFVYPDDSDAVSAALQKAVGETGVFQAEYRIVRADNGDVRWMSGFGRTIVKDESGKATRMVGVMFDITGQKQIEKLKDEFIGVASHELRTPITSIKVYAEMLQEMFDERNDTSSGALMQKVNTQLDKLTALVYALLDATRINEGQLALEKASFDMDELIRETAELMQLAVGKHHIDLRLNAASGVEADRERIRQVLINLINNAVKYSPAVNNIIVTSSEVSGQIKVCVQDFGIGISDASQKRLFERFFRDEDAGSFAGLGLGLFISAKIIREHGGEISVKSEKGKGSTFCFTIPGGVV